MHESFIMNQTALKFPLSDFELSDLTREAKRTAMAYFQTNLIGPDVSFYTEKLSQKLTQRKCSLKAENQESCKMILSGFMTENYKVILNRLRSGPLNYQDFEKDLKNFQIFIRNHGPDYGIKELSLLEFCLNATNSANDLNLKQLNYELKLQKTTTDTSRSSTLNEVSTLREAFSQEKDELSRKIASLEKEKAALIQKEVSLHDQIKTLKIHLDRIEQGNRDIVKSLKTETQKELQSLQNKLTDVEDANKEFERQIYQIESDKNQELALLQQKLAFYEKTLDESNVKVQKLTNELKNDKRAYAQNLKDVQFKYESEIQTFQAKISQETERFTDFEGTLNDKETEIEQLKIISSRNELQLSNCLRESKEEIQILKAKIDQKDLFYKKESENAQKSAELELRHLRDRLIETEAKLKEKETIISSGNSIVQKEIAILQQKSEFLEQELSESKRVIEEERRMHETMLHTMNRVTGDIPQEEMQADLEILRNSHKDMLKSAELTIEKLKQDLGKEILALKQSYRELEVEAEANLKTHSAKERDLSEAIESLNYEKSKLSEKIKSLLTENNTITEAYEIKLKRKIKDLETKIESLTFAHVKETTSLKSDHEQVISQLKRLHLDEKTLLEQRLKDDKERSEKKYSIVCEEYEDRLKEEQEKYEDEINSLQEELKDYEDSKAKEIQQYKHKLALDSQKIANLENYLQNLKEQLSSIQQSHSQAIESQLNGFNSERSLLLDKIERLVGEVSLKEREVTTMEFRLESVQSKAKESEKELEESKEQMIKERSAYLDRMDMAKKANHKLADEVNQKKSDYKREIALANQHIEFQAAKIAELEKSLQDSNNRGTPNKSRADFSQDSHDAIEKLTQEKEAIHRKLESKRKSLRELNTKLQNLQIISDKDNAILLEKLEILTQKKQDIEQKLNEDITELKDQLSCRDGVVIRDKSTILKENDALKTSVSELERKIAELLASIDRDKTLWENKFSFLTSQRDQARNSMSEAQRKFELALEQLQKRGNRDKDKAETANLLSSVEANYNHQLRELQDANQNVITDLINKIKLLEKELKSSKDDLDHDRRLRSGDLSTLEKRVADLSESEQNLKAELETSNRIKEKELKEATEILKNDIEGLRQKLIEVEQRALDAEQHKNVLFLECEKEKAKWTLERDHLISQKNEGQDLIERLEKRKETLLREVEKLRAERGSNRRASSNARSRPVQNQNKTFMVDDLVKKEDLYHTPINAFHEYSPQPFQLKNEREYTKY